LVRAVSCGRGGSWIALVDAGGRGSSSGRVGRGSAIGGGAGVRKSGLSAGVGDGVVLRGRPGT
jgi:hypothetical protein